MFNFKKKKQVEEEYEDGGGIDLSNLDVDDMPKKKKRAVNLSNLDEEDDFDEHESNDEFDGGDSEYDPEFDRETEYDESKEFDPEFDEGDEDHEQVAWINKMMKVVGFLVVIAVAGGIIWMVFSAKAPKQEEQKQENKTEQVEQKQDEQKQDEVKKEEEKPKEEAKKDTKDTAAVEKEANKALEKGDSVVPEKEAKNVVDEVTKQFDVVAKDNGDYANGTKPVFTVTNRSSMTSLNTMIKVGFTIDNIKVYNSDSSDVYQFTMTMKDKDGNVISWAGNYSPETKGIELAKYYGELPTLTGKGPQVDESKRTKVENEA